MSCGICCPSFVKNGTSARWRRQPLAHLQQACPEGQEASVQESTGRHVTIGTGTRDIRRRDMSKCTGPSSETRGDMFVQ